MARNGANLTPSCTSKSVHARRQAERVGPLEEASECRDARGFRISAVSVRQRRVTERSQIAFRRVSHVLCSTPNNFSDYYFLSAFFTRWQTTASGAGRRAPTAWTHLRPSPQMSIPTKRRMDTILKISISSKR